MSVEITTTMQARTRTVWLTDHPGCTVADFERVKAPSPRTAAARREHSTYLDWHSSPRVKRLIGLPVTDNYQRTAEQQLWLTDHPGCTVADFERVRSPAAKRREHSAYLDWLGSDHVMLAIRNLARTP